jgi:hypothetical protein
MGRDPHVLGEDADADQAGRDGLEDRVAAQHPQGGVHGQVIPTPPIGTWRGRRRQDQAVGCPEVPVPPESNAMDSLACPHRLERGR